MINIKDCSLLPIILRTAARGEIDLTVSLKKTLQARRAPSILSLFLTNFKNKKPSFGKFMSPPHQLYYSTITNLKKSEIGTNKGGNDLFLTSPKDLLPDFYDIHEFRPNDYVYINEDALINLENNGITYINSFLCPDVTEQIIRNTESLYGGSLFDKNYDELPNDKILLELPHGALDTTLDITLAEAFDRILSESPQKANPRNSIAFYPDANASFYISRELKEIFPCTLHKLLKFISADPNDANLKLTYDNTKYDYHLILDKCSVSIKNDLKKNQMNRCYILKLLSYVEKWAPLDTRDGNIKVELQDLYIDQYHLDALIEVVNSISEGKKNHNYSNQFNTTEIKNYG